MQSKKILFFANTSWYFFNFRKGLISQLMASGGDVALVSPTDIYSEKLVELGFRHIPFNFHTKSTNIFKEFAVIFRLAVLYRSEKPDMVHHFTIKCVLYGTLAALIAGKNTIKIVNSITGLGHLFTSTNVRARILKKLVMRFYRLLLDKKNSLTIFQNEDDSAFFVSKKLIKLENIRLISSSGVNTNKFSPFFPRVAATARPIIKVLYASRLLKEKGIEEVIESANILCEQLAPIEFIIAGSIYPDNPTSLNEDDIRNLRNKRNITYLGHVEEMVSLIEDCDMVILPSYREGTPKILLEAAAMQKPIIATDVPGCRRVIVHEVNGLLVPPQDAKALADAIRLLSDKPELRVSMGLKGRQMVLEQFEESIIVSHTMNVYKELISVQ